MQYRYAVVAHRKYRFSHTSKSCEVLIVHPVAVPAGEWTESMHHLLEKAKDTTMATVLDRTDESTLGTGLRRWTVLLDRLEHGSPWLVVVAYTVVYAVVLVGAAIVALYLAALILGVAGAAVFFTVGLAIVAAAPTAARRVFIQALYAIGASRGA